MLLPLCDGHNAVTIRDYCSGLFLEIIDMPIQNPPPPHGFLPQYVPQCYWQYASFFHHMLEQGVYLPCSQFEAWFFSAAIGEEEVAFLLRAAEHAFAAMRRS